MLELCRLIIRTIIVILHIYTLLNTQRCKMGLFYYLLNKCVLFWPKLKQTNA